ncbi:MAG: transglycosylase domain-containing protein, partial [Eubacterium sp.]|nr:transglycosylase domain-containing protein [Eubacterium sp.]
MNFGEKQTAKKSEKLASQTPQTLRHFGVLVVRVLVFAAFVGIIYIGYLMMKDFAQVIANTPDATAVEIIPKGYATTVLDCEDDKIETLSMSDLNRKYVVSDQIPINLRRAFIAIEDPEFMDHEGIDTIESLKSLYNSIIDGGDFTQKSVDTITEQLLKNQVSYEKPAPGFINGFLNFFREKYMAVKLETLYTKDELLEYYLNTINLGRYTLGVETAAQRYFNKSVSDLSLSESALLAGMAKNPTAYDPILHTGKCKKRQLAVLTAMQDQGMITYDEYEAALKDDVFSRVQRYNRVYMENLSPISYFTNALVSEIINDMKEELGYTQTQAMNAIYTGGLTIHSTHDMQMQTVCDEECTNPQNYPDKISYMLNYQLTVRDKNGVEKAYNFADIKKWYKPGKLSQLFDDEETARAVIVDFRRETLDKEDTVIAESIELIPQPQVSFVLTDPATGEVKALVGGRDEESDAIVYDRATTIPRQPGTALSPLSSYIPAIDTAGFTLGTVQNDEEYYYPGTEELVKDNFKSYMGLTTIRDSMDDLVNVISVKTLDKVTPKVGYDYLLNMGFSTLVDGYSDDSGQNYTDISLSTAVGKLKRGVTGLDMTSAYAALAGGGVYNAPHFYTTVVDRSGNVILDRSSDPSKRIMKESTAWLVTDALREDVENAKNRITFGDSGMAVAGVSGQSENSADLWHIGYTPYLAGGIWSGYDTGKSVKEKKYHEK